jgi:hypothetical protein
VVTIIAYSTSAGAAFEGRAPATVSPSAGGEPFPPIPATEAGTTAFSVDASRSPGRSGDPGKAASPIPREQSSLPIGVPLLLVVLAAGGIVVALITGRKRAESLDAESLDAGPLDAGSDGAGPRVAGGPPGGDDVRVVPHFDSGPRVTVREAHRSLTNVVRLEPHPGVPMVEVEERK